MIFVELLVQFMQSPSKRQDPRQYLHNPDVSRGKAETAKKEFGCGSDVSDTIVKGPVHPNPGLQPRTRTHTTFFIGSKSLSESSQTLRNSQQDDGKYLITSSRALPFAIPLPQLVNVADISRLLTALLLE